MDVANINQNSSVTDFNLPKQIETKAITQPGSEPQNLNDNKYDEKDLKTALKKIDNFLKDEHVYTEYSYHKEMKTMMIKVVDEATKEVILEIPPKKILDMVASMCKQFGLFDKKA